MDRRSRSLIPATQNVQQECKEEMEDIKIDNAFLSVWVSLFSTRNDEQL